MGTTISVVLFSRVIKTILSATSGMAGLDTDNRLDTLDLFLALVLITFCPDWVLVTVQPCLEGGIYQVLDTVVEHRVHTNGASGTTEDPTVLSSSLFLFLFLMPTVGLLSILLFSQFANSSPLKVTGFTTKL